MVNKAVHKVVIYNPKNRRLRYLTRNEADILIEKCPKHLKPIVQLALNTGMRKGEILKLTWDKVDLKNGLILLEQDDTKNSERREIPLNETAKNVFSSIIRRIDIPYVFHEKGKAYKQVHKSFVTACTSAKVLDFHFHDLRPYFCIMACHGGNRFDCCKRIDGPINL